MVAMIERAARDPAIDVDKMERLFTLYEKQQARQAEVLFHAAMAQLQDELPIIHHSGKILNKQGDVQSTYAKWEDINPAITPILKAHGFSLSFRTDTNGQNSIRVEGVLSHEGGHSERTTLTLPADNSGSKNAVQAVASSVSYGKRYTAGALLNITTTGEDDDGQAAGANPGPERVSQEQADMIQARLSETNTDKDRFLAVFGRRLIGTPFTSLADIPASDFDTAIKVIDDNARQRAKVAARGN